jgi:HK97 gp10 family phage protein
MRINQVSYKSFTKEISKEVDKNAREELSKACQLVKKDLDDVLNSRQKSAPGSPPGKLSGQLRKGNIYRIEKGYGIFGEVNDHTGLVGNANFKANWMEFGTSKMAARPFMVPTFEKNRDKIKEIMTGKLVSDK